MTGFMVAEETMNQREARLFDYDMSFKEYRGPLVHRIHGFAAKFPPQLPRYFIQSMSEPGDTVLDPMAGSGTTLVEAMLLGRKSVGIDIDPLAILLSKVKTGLCDSNIVTRYAKKIATQASIELMEKGSRLSEATVNRYLAGYDMEAREFFSYWFPRNVVVELSLLVAGINRLKDDDVKDALKVALSSIIIRKSAGVSLARDISHSRPHKVREKKVRAAIPLFEKAAMRIAKALDEARKMMEGQSCFPPLILRGDAKTLPIGDESVKLIVTSPPYATAVDYMRAHKFSLLWLHYPLQYLSKLRGKYVGSERTGSVQETKLSEIANKALQSISVHDVRKARTIARYFGEMRYILQEMYRVLQSDGQAIIVVGPSTITGVKLPTHKVLVEMGTEEGFKLLRIKEREIARDWRQLPVSNNSKKVGIESRIHEEYIIAFRKAS